MARISFTLRQPDSGGTSDEGAAVRSTRSDGTYDSALKAEGLQFAAASNPDTFLEANPIGYGAVEVNWGIPLIGRDAAGEPDYDGSVQIIHPVLCYSLDGPPETVDSGIVLYDGYESSTYTHLSTDSRPMSAGRWVYYSLFAFYASDVGQDERYEKLAHIQVMNPKNYGSTLGLWDRIPNFYRSEDYKQAVLDNSFYASDSDYAKYFLGGTPQNGYAGPLYKYLSIIGYNIDYTRSIVDYVMTARDPAFAGEDTLNAIADQLGIDFKTSDLGSKRLRSMLNGVGKYRRRKGTRAAIEHYVKSITGSDIEIDEVANEVTIFAQRVNYVLDPVDMTPVTTGTTNGYPNGNSGIFHRSVHAVEGYPLPVGGGEGAYNPTGFTSGTTSTYPVPANGSTTYFPGMYWTVDTAVSSSASGFDGTPDIAEGDYIVVYGDGPADIADVEFGVRGRTLGGSSTSTLDPSSPYSTTAYTDLGTVYTPTSSFSNGVSHMLVHFKDPVAVKYGDTVTFSIHADDALTNGEYTDTYVTDSVKAVRLVAEDGTLLSETTTYVRAGDAWGYQVPAGFGISETSWTIAFVEVVVDMGAVSTAFDLSKVVIERNSIGGYFDGDTSYTGSVLDNGVLERDCAWDGNPNQSVSLYTEQRRRTAGVINALLYKALPVGQTYTIPEYAALPGQARIDQYYTANGNP